MIIGFLLVLLSAAGFAFIPIFAVYAYDAGVNVFTLLFLRFLLAAAIFFVWLLIRKQLQRLRLKQLLSIALLGGVFYATQSILYFSSVKFIPASLAVLLLYLYPIMVALLSSVVNKEKINIAIVLPMILSFAGIALAIGSPLGEIQTAGVVLAIGAAICLAVYFVLGNLLTAAIPTVLMSAYLSLFASLSFFMVGIITRGLDFSFAATAWFAIAGVALFSTVISIFSLFAGMKYIGPTKASIVSMIEPVITIFFSAVLLGDQLTFLQGLGAIVVVTGAVLVFVLRNRANT